MTGWLWNLAATWCLTYEGGRSVLKGWWLTEGDWWAPTTITVTLHADPTGFEAAMRRAAETIRDGQ